MRTKVLLALALCFGLGAPAAHPQASPYSNSVFPSKILTGTGQTSAVIQLNGLVVPSTIGSSFASGTITLTGSSLTTVTFAVMGSSDNGATYYALPIYVGASPTTSPTTSVTATANGLYQINLAGLTHIKFVTSGTFTATNVTFTLTASPNALISRGVGSGAGAQGPPGTDGTNGTNGTNGNNGASSFAGAYSSGSTYPLYTAVSEAGSSYVSLVAGNLGHDPATSPTYWALLAAAGTNGSNGATGAAGSQGSVTALAGSVLPVMQNLFDINKIVPGVYINNSGGFSTDDRWNATGLIYCPGATSMISNLPITLQYGVPNFALYDANGNYVSSEPASYFGSSYSGNAMLPGVAFPLPGTQVYVRFNYAVTYLSVFNTLGYPPDATTGMVYAVTSGTAVLPSSFSPFGYDTVSDVNSKIATAVDYAQALPLSYATLGSTTVSTGTSPLASPQAGFGGGQTDVLPGVLPQGSYVESITLHLTGPGNVDMVFGTFDGPEAPYNTFTVTKEMVLSTSNAVLVGPNTYKWTAPSAYSMFTVTLPYTHFGVVSSAGSSTVGVVGWPRGSGHGSLFYEQDGYIGGVGSSGAVYGSQVSSDGQLDANVFTRATPPVPTPGDVPETRPFSVQAHKADGATTIFTATGPGNVEGIQYAILGTYTGAHAWGPEAIITITVDGGTPQSTTLGLFMLWDGYITNDGTLATSDLFLSKYLGITTANSTGTSFNGGYRHIYIKYNTSCTITIVPPSGFGGSIYSQVEYYPGVAPVGRYPVTRNVFHMYQNDWATSTIGVSASLTLLPTVTAAGGELESIYFVSSAPGSVTPGWLEQSPVIQVDGTTFTYGGTEDFFGNQFYGDQFHGRSDEWGIGRYYRSGSPDSTTYWTAYRYFKDHPMTFGASLAAHWTNGTSGNAATKVGSLVVYYTTN